MIEFNVQVDQWLGGRAVTDDVTARLRRAIIEAGHFVRKEAIARAPISPKQEQSKVYSQRHRKGSAARKKLEAKGITFTSNGWAERKKGTKAKKTPGGLERSISVEFVNGGDAAHIFIPLNAEAGKYADRIHNKRGITWTNLGPGSLAKQKPTGGRVGEKFIDRAYSENIDKVDKIFKHHFRGMA